MIRILILCALLALLTGCGGGAAALPFGPPGDQPDETAQPVTCQPSGCAK